MVNRFLVPQNVERILVVSIDSRKATSEFQNNFILFTSVSRSWFTNKIDNTPEAWLNKVVSQDLSETRYAILGIDWINSKKKKNFGVIFVLKDDVFLRLSEEENYGELEVILFPNKWFWVYHHNSISVSFQASAFEWEVFSWYKKFFLTLIKECKADNNAYVEGNWSTWKEFFKGLKNSRKIKKRRFK